tara:strand:+ start:192 stop:380 length:189 start_codon:yes stop_codon:yes gene_type:complete
MGEYNSTSSIWIVISCLVVGWIIAKWKYRLNAEGKKGSIEDILSNVLLFSFLGFMFYLEKCS